MVRLLFISVHILITGITSAKDVDIKDVTYNMIMIPSGKFMMGCNQFGPMHGAPERKVYLDSFMIDKYEVTNSQYEEIIPEHDLRRSIFSKCDHCPVTNVSWYSAADYCYLIGKSLPSEAQWERAAGSGNGCVFPWGNDFKSNANKARGGLKFRDTSKPVGSFPPNDNGLFDMGGNVWEWVSDWMSPGYNFPQNMYNPLGPEVGRMKVRRGGSYKDTIIAMTTGYRDWSHPTSRYFSDIGFRCAINIIRKDQDGVTGQD